MRSWLRTGRERNERSVESSWGKLLFLIIIYLFIIIIIIIVFCTVAVSIKKFR